MNGGNSGSATVAQQQPWPSSQAKKQPTGHEMKNIDTHLGLYADAPDSGLALRLFGLPLTFSLIYVPLLIHDPLSRLFLLI